MYIHIRKGAPNRSNWSLLGIFSIYNNILKGADVVVVDNFTGHVTCNSIYSCSMFVTDM